jgi:hypothetical protein
MKKLLIIITITALVNVGCKKDFLSSLQNNPNAPTTSAATPPLVLPGTLTSIVNNNNGTGTYQAQADWMGYWNYSPGYSFNSTVANYVMTGNGPQCWDNYYNIISNLNFIIQITSSDPKWANYNAIANILEAFCYKNLVDVYNDVPYTQAMKAQGAFFPKYDKGSDVYDSLVAKLDKAIVSINNQSPTEILPTSDDIMFGGNMKSWQQLANTIKLSLLIQESGVSAKQSYLATEAASNAYAGYLTSDAFVNPGYTGTLPSPMWGGFGVSPSGTINGSFTYLKGNSVCLNFYKTTNDKRLGYIYSINGVAPNNPTYFTVSNNPSDYDANPTGSQSNSVQGGGSGIGPGLVNGPTQSAVFMLAAQSYFLQAEATVRGWLPGGNTAAQVLYQQGITKSYEFLNVGGSASAADAAAAAYYGQNASFVAFPVSATPDSLIHTIIEQKWAALNGSSNIEAYNDWRRTYNGNLGYPIIWLSVSNSNIQSHMPFRYYYPTSESNVNTDAYNAAGGPTIDPFNSKIFWMP